MVHMAIKVKKIVKRKVSARPSSYLGSSHVGS
jgi:hypothetical protein